MYRGRYAAMALVVAAALAGTPGCTGLKSHWQRHRRPHYTIRPEFYASPFKTIAVLPVTPRYQNPRQKKQAQSGADAIRAAFYRHFSVKDPQDIELSRTDSVLEKYGLLADERTPEAPTAAGRIAAGIQQADVTGLTQLINPWLYMRRLGLTKGQAFGAQRFESKRIEELNKILPADAYALGTSEQYGWLYAIVFSYVKVEGKMRLYAGNNGKLIWKGRGKEASLETIIASIFEIPLKFVKVWFNARSRTLDRTTDDLFRCLVRTIPVQDRAIEVEVVARAKAPLFKRRGYSYCPWSRYGKVPANTRMEYLIERDGWLQVRTTLKGRAVTAWVFRGHAEVLEKGESGRVIRPLLTMSDIINY